MKRKRRWLGAFFLLGIGMLMGLIIGGAMGAHPAYDEQVVVRMDGFETGREFAFSEEQFAPQVVIPEMPAMPEMPEMPAMPEMPGIPEIREVHPYRIPTPERIEIIHNEPSLFQWFRALSNTVAGVALIGVGVWLLAKRRQEPLEKSPQA